MKFVISSATLQKQLSALSGVIMSNPHIPILENFLFDIDAGKLTVSASDLQISMTTQLEIDSTETGSLAVPAKQFLETLKNLPDQPVTIVMDEDNSSIEITSFNGKYKLTGEAAEEFPKIPQPDGEVKLGIASEVLGQAIHNTFFSISNDELRPAMTGLYLNLDKSQAAFVSTDGNRLVRYLREDITSDDSISMIIPKKALGLLKSSLPSDNTDVQAQFSSSHAFFSFDNISLICRLIDENFPDYQNAIPKDNPNIMNINRVEILNSLKRLAIYTNKATNQVRFELSNNKIEIFAEDLDYSNEAHENLVCEYAGEEMEIGFNAKFLIEMLGNLDAEMVQFALSRPNLAGTLVPKEQNEDEDILMLLMPVMLNKYA